MTNPSLMTLVRKLPTSHYWKRRPGKNPSHIKQKLKKQNLVDHIDGLYAVGLSPIGRGKDKTLVALFDLDNHSDDDVAVRAIGQEIIDASVEYGLHATVFTSSGGRGLHVYYVWDEPQDAYSVRKSLEQVLEDCLLISGTGGLEKNQVEVFPKQDAVGKDEFGSMFILPYAFESEWLSGSWQASQPVTLLQREDSHESAGVVDVDLELVQSALDAIENDDLDYDEWRNIVFAIHSATGGSAEGLKLACAWSSKSGKHDEAFLTERVWPYAKAGRGITARTLLAKARIAGWNDDVLMAFDDLGKNTPDATADAPTRTSGKGDSASRGSAAAMTTSPTTLPPFKRDSKGAIEATIVNIEAALRAAMPGGVLGFDNFTQQIMIKRDGEWEALRETANIAMRLELERKGFKPISKEAFRDVLLKVAEETTFDSAHDWLDGLVWDEVPRIDGFLTRYFGAEDTAYHRAVSRYWWSAMAGRVCQPGLQTDMVPVLVGAQGSGKSTALARMVPQREQLVEIDLTARDADLSRIMQGALIGEIAELRGLHSREDEHIKAFITRTQEKWVPKYQEYPRVFDRRLMFVGTTNQSEFLSDYTGNRRWLPVSVDSIDRDALEQDRDQLWAEGHALYCEHGVIFRKAERLAKFAHSDFEIEDPWANLIDVYLIECENDFDADEIGGAAVGEMRLTSNQILTLSGAMPDVARINRSHQHRLGRIMHSLGWVACRFWSNPQNKQIRGWRKLQDKLV